MRIVCMDNRLEEIYLQGSLATYYKIKDDLRILCHENCWSFQNLFFRDQALIRSNFQAQFLSGEYQGVPLFLTQELEIRLNPVHLTEINVSVGQQNSLRLMGTYQEEGWPKYCTLYSTRFYEHIEDNFQLQDVQGVLKKLMENEPLTFPEFMGFVQSRKRSKDGDITVAMIKNLISIHWLSERPFQDFAISYDMDEEMEVDGDDDITMDDIMLFETSESEEFYGTGFMDDEQLAVNIECTEAVTEETDVMQGLEITAEMILAVNKPETLTRSEYLKSIRVLPKDQSGKNLMVAIKFGHTDKPHIMEAAKELGYKVALVEETIEEPVQIDF